MRAAAYPPADRTHSPRPSRPVGSLRPGPDPFQGEGNASGGARTVGARSGGRGEGGAVLGQGHQGEGVPVVVVVQVEDAREAGSGPGALLPGPGVLPLDQVADAATYGGPAGLAG